MFGSGAKTFTSRYPKEKDNKPVDDTEDEIGKITDSESRVLRGGSFANHASGVRSAYRYNYVPADRCLDHRFSCGEDFTAWLLYCFTPYPVGVEK